MKKELQNKITGGLDSLLNPTPTATKPQPTATQQEPAEKPRTAYKTVCYNIRPDLIEAVKNIAYWDRKRANAVVTEALEAYINEWNKHKAK